jgi:hypothetical protein
VGCTPFEALLASTLNAFFSQTFVDYLIDVLIIQSLDKTPEFIALKALYSSIPSRFYENDLVETLVIDSFIELWSTTADYSIYYHEESKPNQCDHSYTTQNEVVFVISTLLYMTLFNKYTKVMCWKKQNALILVGSASFDHKRYRQKSFSISTHKNELALFRILFHVGNTVCYLYFYCIIKFKQTDVNQQEQNSYSNNIS